MKEFKRSGTWIRQDPGFPDVLYQTNEPVKAGFEVKAWYPFATEITGRFKDSQRRFSQDQTYVLMFAWVPEHMLFGRPKLLDMCIVSARSVAESRDRHYHNPPDYIVIEPLDTSGRTRNLQQTNTSGYKFQGTPEEMEEARSLIAKWGEKRNTNQLPNISCTCENFKPTSITGSIPIMPRWIVLSTKGLRHSKRK